MCPSAFSNSEKYLRSFANSSWCKILCASAPGKHIDSKYLQLVSPSYFISSFKKMLLISSKPIPTTIKINNTFTRLVDGSITYDLKYRSAAPDEIEKRAIDQTGCNIYAVEKFDKLSPEISLLLEKFIEHLRNIDIEVSFFLAYQIM